VLHLLAYEGAFGDITNILYLPNQQYKQIIAHAKRYAKEKEKELKKLEAQAKNIDKQFSPPYKNIRYFGFQ
jgi:hypothetical protein